MTSTLLDGVLIFLRLADFCLSLAKTDYPLPLASLFTDFSESKRWTKDFRRSNAAAKARLRGGFRLPQLTAPPKTTKSSFRIVYEVVLRNRRATGARIWGSVQNQTILAQVSFLIYSSSQQDLFFCPARCREMTTAEFYFYVWLDKNTVLH